MSMYGYDGPPQGGSIGAAEQYLAWESQQGQHTQADMQRMASERGGLQAYAQEAEAQQRARQHQQSMQQAPPASAPVRQPAPSQAVAKQVAPVPKPAAAPRSSPTVTHPARFVTVEHDPFMIVLDWRYIGAQHLALIGFVMAGLALLIGLLYG